MIRVIFLMGTTCSGKGTFCEYAKQMLGDAVYVIGVGAILRQRHDPSYFNGLGAQEKTEKEVWEIFDEEYRKALAQPGVALIIVDGQPRLPVHVTKTMKYANAFTEFVHVMFYASPDVRRARVEGRFPYVESDEENAKILAKRNLAYDRINNDVLQLFEVWSLLSLLEQKVVIVNTELPPETFQGHLLSDLAGGTTAYGVLLRAKESREIQQMMGALYGAKLNECTPPANEAKPVIQLPLPAGWEQAAIDVKEAPKDGGQS